MGKNLRNTTMQLENSTISCKTRLRGENHRSIGPFYIICPKFIQKPPRQLHLCKRTHFSKNIIVKSYLLKSNSRLRNQSTAFYLSTFHSKGTVEDCAVVFITTKVHSRYDLSASSTFCTFHARQSLLFSVLSHIFFLMQGYY